MSAWVVVCRSVKGDRLLPFGPGGDPAHLGGHGGEVPRHGAGDTGEGWPGSALTSLAQQGEAAGDGALAPQPGPAPKKFKTKTDNEAKEKEEDAEETVKKEGVGEKVAALEKEIEATERELMSAEVTLAVTQGDRNELRAQWETRKEEFERQKETAERDYRQRNEELYENDIMIGTLKSMKMK